MTEYEVDHVIQKLKVAIVVLIGSVLFAAGGFVYNVLDVNRVETRVTKVENSPCTLAYLEPDNQAAENECQRILRSAALNQSLEAACIPFRIVMRSAPYKNLTRCSLQP